MTTLEFAFAYSLVLRIMRLYKKSKSENHVEVHLPEGVKFLITFGLIYVWLIFINYLFP